MGGYGSGRPGRYPTAEACASYCLDSALLRRARLRCGMHGTVRVSWSDGFAVELTIDTREAPFAELAHDTRDRHEERIVYRIWLTWTVPHFGGRRWWWQCPSHGAKAAKLYLPLGGRRFLSRNAYRLGYACQREAVRDRLLRRLRKLDRVLGGDGDGWPDYPPDKPKWMRWRTYERKVEEWTAAYDRASGAADAALVPIIARLLENRG